MSSDQKNKQVAGGPIVETRDLETAHKSGEAAQKAREEKPAQRVSETDRTMMSSSGQAAQDRRKAEK
jgi:hypothetical protein